MLMQQSFLEHPALEVYGGRDDHKSVNSVLLFNYAPQLRHAAGDGRWWTTENQLMSRTGNLLSFTDEKEP